LLLLTLLAVPPLLAGAVLQAAVTRARLKPIAICLVRFMGQFYETGGCGSATQ
jgi:hypothetical protein